MTIASLFLALAVTAAADSSSGDVVLMDFHASWCGPCQTMRPQIAKLAQRKYPIRSVDIDRSPKVAEQFNVKRVPTFIVADPQGRVLARHEGVIEAAELANLFNQAKLKAIAAADPPVANETSATADRDQADAVDDPPTEAADASVANPRPWETVVRIKMKLSSAEWGFGSGTIIYSDADQSIILTCAHIFKDKNQRPQSLKNFATPIAIDLFSKSFVKHNPSTLACVESDIRGEVIDYDYLNDVGLIRIRPGRRLPSSRVVPASWQPKGGMKMYSVGCSHGNDATAWDTRILDPRVQMNSGESNKSFFEMKCANQPAEGRSGGGLYTTEGFVAGVCNFADPRDHVGLYATPTAIHKLLDRADLTALYKPSSPGSGSMLAAANRPSTRARLQSPSPDDDVAGPAEARKLTIPDPEMFKIPTPETRVASNSGRPKAWQASDPDDGSRSVRPGRRPDRDSGEIHDPGAGPRGFIPTEIPLEPNGDSDSSEIPGPAPSQSPAQSGSPLGRNPPTKWKGVHTTRPRPSN